jgi:diaminopimelate decarboxylase
MTVARVAFRKQDLNGDWLIGLEMNRTQMFSSSADFLLEPTVIYKEKPTANDESVKAFFVGAYCLEQEFLLKRKIKLEKLPAIGDAVCFPNTAGYMMHFFESEAHLFDLAENLVFNDAGSNKFMTDKEYAEQHK